jgi:Family of unknown function (DUF6496)
MIRPIAVLLAQRPTARKKLICKRFARSGCALNLDTTHPPDKSDIPGIPLFDGIDDDAAERLTLAIEFTTRRNQMARYGKAAGKSVKSALHREKRGTLRSGKGGRGGRVTTRKQAIAIGLSEARKKGARVPAKKSS